MQREHAWQRAGFASGVPWEVCQNCGVDTLMLTALGPCKTVVEGERHV